MKTPVAALLAVTIPASLAGCGGEEERLALPDPNSPRVAMTVDYPGLAPMALITYRSEGRRCHALGVLTGGDARVLETTQDSLAGGLAERGRCVAPTRRLVSLATGRPAGGRVQLVGGLVRSDVSRVTIAGQRVRPRGGKVLIAHLTGSGTLGRAVRVELRDGRVRNVPLQQALS